MERELRASGEDYLEAVLILGQRMRQVRAIDVAQYLGYAKTSVSHGLRLLREGGLLTRDEAGYLYLTESGREAAERIYARHRFFAGWLMRAGVAPDTAEKDACRMEHAISEESFRRLMRALESEQAPGSEAGQGQTQAPGLGQEQTRAPGPEPACGGITE